MNKLLLFSSVLTLGLAMGANATLSSNSLIICRGMQCADAKYTMSKEYLFNQIADLFEKNITKEVLLCEADPASHRCIEPGIRLNGQTNNVKANISIESAEVVDSKLLKGQTAIDTILDFAVDANGTRPRCQSALSQLRVMSIDDVQMNVGGFDCSFTETGNSTMNMSYKIDMIDFDYGLMGAYYTLGSGQVMRGGKNGYVLWRFTEKMPGSVYLLSDSNSPEAQAAYRKQMSERLSAETAARAQAEAEVIRLKEQLTLKGTAVPGGVNTCEGCPGIVKDSVKEESSYVKSTVKGNLQARTPVINTNQTSKTIVTDVVTDTTTTVVETKTPTIVVQQPAPQVMTRQTNTKVIVPDIPCSNQSVVDGKVISNCVPDTQTVVQKFVETDNDGRTITREVTTTTTTEPEQGFWGRVWDKTQKVIYLEEGLW